MDILGTLRRAVGFVFKKDTYNITFQPNGTAYTVDTVVSMPDDQAASQELAGIASTQTLTNKTIVAANNTVTTAASGNIVATELDAAIAEGDTNLTTHAGDTTTHGTTGDIVGTSDAQTLTNKTLTSPNVNEAVALSATATELNQLDGVTVGGTSAGDIATIDDTQTLTNKTIDVDNNTLSNIETDNLKSGVLNISTTLATASDTQVPSALATKTYVDDVAAAQNEASEILFTPADNNDWTGDVDPGEVNDALDQLATRAEAGETHAATTSAHGVAGDVVGTSDTQTLTNKTITSPNVNEAVALTSTATELNQLDGVAVGGTGAGDIITTDNTQTLSDKTLTSPVLNTGVSGTAVLDEDDMVSDSATHLATQQSIKTYVDAEISTVSNVTADYSAKVADYTITDIDGIRTVGMTAGGTDKTVTLPTATDNNHRIITVKKLDTSAGNCIIDGEGSETIDGETTVTLYDQYESITLQCDGSNWFSIDQVKPTISETIFFEAAPGHGSVTNFVKFRYFGAAKEDTSNKHLYSESTTGAGTKVRVETKGMYAINYMDSHGGGGWHAGITINAYSGDANNTGTEYGNTNVQSLTSNANGMRRLQYSFNAANAHGWTQLTIFLEAGDVIRPHTDGTPSDINPQSSNFRVTKIN